VKRKFVRVGLGVLVVAVGTLILPNARALYEGIFFHVRPAISPNSIRPINRDGRYASLYDLVHLRNAERLDYLPRHLDLPNVSVVQIPIPNSKLQNVFVRFSAVEPYTIFCAHYDKLYDDERYQGASDNTAAVSVLLASITELARRGDAGNRAFLFTGEEEHGLRGAKTFVEYAHTNNIAIREIVNFDGLGRGKLAIRPSADVVGLVFTLPLYGDITYDGREFRRSPPYPPANARLTQSLLRAQPNIVVLERFTALGDSNAFQQNGIPTVAINSDDMYFLEMTWHSYADRVELLDERNLDLAFELIVGYNERTP
jgi:hypothetical protein